MIEGEVRGISELTATTPLVVRIDASNLSSAEIGSKLIEWSNRVRPASTSIQGALIALNCQENGVIDPRSIGESFIADEVEFRKLMEIASRAHVARGMNPRIENAEDVVRQSFLCAEYFLPLNREALIDVAINFHRVAMQLDVKYRETNIRTQIYEKYGEQFEVTLDEFRSMNNDYKRKTT